MKHTMVSHAVMLRTALLYCMLILFAAGTLWGQDSLIPAQSDGSTNAGNAQSLPKQDPAFNAAAEQKIFELVNLDRVRFGLKALKRNPLLDKTSAAHSVLLAEHEALSHQFPGEPELVKRIVATGLRFVDAGENVVSAEDAVTAHEALMGSSEHRANIMNPTFNSVGIGVIKRGDQIYVTEDFAKVMPKVADGSAEMELVKEYNEIRAGAGLPPLKVVPLPSLHEAACQMARNDKLDAKSVHVDGARYVVAFATLDLHKLPESAQELAKLKMKGISVGVCFATSKTYTFPMYWIIVATYFDKTH